MNADIFFLLSLFFGTENEAATNLGGGIVGGGGAGDARGSRRG